MSADLMPKVMALAHKMGRVDVCHVYGNSNSQKNWSGVMSVRFLNAGYGKNAADMLLSLDAMELCAPGAFQTVLLASSDVDFMHLAQRLRARGCAVVGAGAVRANAQFQNACTRFEVLSDLKEDTPLGSRGRNLSAAP